MSTHKHEPNGIHAWRLEADNVVAGVQIQGVDAQTASSLIHLAQSIRQGKISVEEIKVRNLFSGMLSDEQHARLRALVKANKV